MVSQIYENWVIIPFFTFQLESYDILSKYSKNSFFSLFSDNYIIKIGIITLFIFNINIILSKINIFLGFNNISNNINGFFKLVKDLLLILEVAKLLAYTI